MTAAALFTQGLILGLSAGVSPGPLSVLVISQALRHGAKEGVKTSFAPLVVDAPIVLGAAFLFSWLADAQALIGVITLIGACFLVYLGWQSFRVQALPEADVREAPRSLLRGALVNFLSPHPYLFWMTVGAPILARAWEVDPLLVAAFIGPFYFGLVGSKVVIALVAGRSRALLLGAAYRRVNQFLGALMWVLALVLLRDGFALIR